MRYAPVCTQLGLASFALIGGALVGLVTVSGCAPTVFTGNPRSCDTTSDCPSGQLCRDGLCEGGDPVGDGGIGAGDDAGGGGDRDGAVDETPTTPPRDEICGNGRDDDGDGMTDEQCACVPGESQSCYGGPVAAAGVGVCALGTQPCDASGEFGSFGTCTGWTPPGEEVCDGIDNDCDGTADEGCECGTGERRDCYTGPLGTAGLGTCAAGSQVCVDGGWGPCDGSVLPGLEVCDGVDNDCDGLGDEGCSCPLGSSRSCFETPTGAPGEGAAGVGACRPGTASCVALPGGGSGFGACEGAVTATSEICRTDIDEDCDGLVDEGCGTPIVDCTVADVLFLVDTTGSMGASIAQIQSGLRDIIIPGLAAEISDVRFAVARFDDFAAGGYGSGTDVPFVLLQASTNNVTLAQNAVNMMGAWGGGDTPESQTEALYQAATGAGLPGWVAPRSCAAGTVGYPCFRAGAQPIILLFTDANFHNGPGGASSYSGVSGPPHSYAQTVAALNAINAKVLGLMSGAAARSDLEAIARDTGALAADGSPIVFDIGPTGSSLSADVVRAVQTLCR